MPVPSRENREEESKVDSAIECAEMFARLDAVCYELRQTVARHFNGARYISDPSTARAIVAAEARRGR